VGGGVGGGARGVGGRGGGGRVCRVCGAGRQCGAYPGSERGGEEGGGVLVPVVCVGPPFGDKKFWPFIQKGCCGQQKGGKRTVIQRGGP